MLFADSTHTASPPWSLICTALSKQSWKWAQPASSNNIPSKLLNSLYLQDTTRALIFTKPFETVSLPQAQLALCQQPGHSHKISCDFSSVLSTFLGISAVSYQHFSVCTQRKRWQHGMQHIFWCLMSLCSWTPAGPELLWICQEAAGNNTTKS